MGEQDIHVSQQDFAQREIEKETEKEVTTEEKGGVEEPSYIIIKFLHSSETELVRNGLNQELKRGDHVIAQSRYGRDIAEVLGRGVTSLGPTRNQLIAKGMIWSPHHGDTAFTVPMFDEFMRRIMPDADWNA